MQFNFYFPKVVDCVEDDFPIEEARKRNKTTRMRVTPSQLPKGCYGIYDSKNGIYIFGKLTPKRLIHGLEHEVVHAVIERIISEHVSTLLDNIKESYWIR